MTMDHKGSVERIDMLDVTLKALTVAVRCCIREMWRVESEAVSIGKTLV